MTRSIKTGATILFAILISTLAACGGSDATGTASTTGAGAGGSSGSSGGGGTSGGTSATIEGIATPSSVSVVTAKNAQ